MPTPVRRAAIVAGGLIGLCWITPSPVMAAWPTKVFSPYVQLDSGDGLQISSVKSTTAQKYYTLAFVVADGSNNATWGGTGSSVASGYYLSQVNSIRSGGGDV